MSTQLEVELMTAFIKWPPSYNTDRDKLNTKLLIKSKTDQKSSYFRRWCCVL